MRVLHLVGSPTDEFFADLSRLYAADCLSAVADPTRYEPVVAHVSPGGWWSFPDSLDPADVAAADPVPVGAAIAHLAALRVDVAVPQLFCRPGMTTYRSLLDLLEIPFVGNTADVMADGADKQRARAIVAAAGVDVPEAEVLRRGDEPSCRGDEPSSAPPMVVKPVDADNSTGVMLVRHTEQYGAAVEAAFAHSDRVLVERYVELGREVRCGVLERDGRLVVLPLEEYAVDTEHKPVRDAADKLARGEDGRLGLVAKDADHAWIVAADDAANGPVGAAATAAYRAMGCRDYGLFDFRIDPDGRPWFLEAGLYCSFARTSVVAVMAAAAGIPVTDLFATAVDAAVRRGPATARGAR